MIYFPEMELAPSPAPLAHATALSVAIRMSTTRLYGGFLNKA